MDSGQSHEALYKLHILGAVCRMTVYGHIPDNSFIEKVRCVYMVAQRWPYGAIDIEAGRLGEVHWFLNADIPAPTLPWTLPEELCLYLINS